MGPQHVIAACWILYLLYWIISARSVKSPAERQSWAGVLAHRLPVWLGAVLMFLPKADPFGTLLTPSPAATKWLGAAIVVLGLFEAVWARKTLAGNWSANVEFKQGHKLVEEGPYRLVRHPIYTSILLMCFGTALMINRLAALAGFLLITFGFLIKLKQEERLLLRHFPDEYPAYKARTKMLVPFVF